MTYRPKLERAWLGEVNKPMAEMPSENNDNFYAYRKWKEHIAVAARYERIKVEFSPGWAASTLPCSCGGEHNSIFVLDTKMYVCPITHWLHWHRLSLDGLYDTPTRDEYFRMLGKGE